MVRKKKTVFVGMSGGVDSSVAALLLRDQGYDVVGVFMRCYNLDGCAERDAEDARRVAGHLGIPFYVWDFEEEYKRRVVEYMVEGYRRGETPNPDVECNREIKFGLFFDRARALGADYVATGHYVRLRRHNANLRMTTNTTNIRPIRNIRQKFVSFGLYTARDAQKDQSYFLWTLGQEQLARCLFPVGEYLKPEVRRIARRAGLPTADKKDSQGICFLGKVSVADFLKTYIPARRGEIVTIEGHPIGVHQGAHFYTIGQRHIGLGNRLPTVAKALAGKQVAGDRKDFKPFYVAEKNVRTNTLTVAEGSDHPTLFKKEITLRDVHFTHPLRIANVGLRIYARVRYRQKLSLAMLTQIRNSKSAIGQYRIVFDHPQKFVAPGQSAVFYLSANLSAKGLPKAGALAKAGASPMEMLGGGIIIA